MMLHCISRLDQHRKVPKFPALWKKQTLTSYAGDKLPTVSSAVAKLRQFLVENKEKDNIYGRAVNGSFPLVVHVENEV